MILLWLTSLFAHTASFAPPAPFVDAKMVIPTLMVHMMYAGADNFLGRQVTGYHANICYTTDVMAQALARAQARLEEEARANKTRWTLLVKDCYRPQRATRDMVTWIKTPSQTMKAVYYPSINKEDIIRHKYLSPTSKHNRGNTVDVTIAAILRDGSLRELSMGTIVDFFGEKSSLKATDLTPQERRHRDLLKKVMGDEFEQYSREWWHFSLKKEPNAGLSYDFPIEVSGF